MITPSMALDVKLFFLGAIFMNVSRIIAGVHYPSDIVGGAIIGTVVTYITFHLAQKGRRVLI